MEIKITFEIGEKTIDLTEVKALTKSGKSKYVRDLLAQFDAGRVSELDETDYDEFYKLLSRKK